MKSVPVPSRPQLLEAYDRLQWDTEAPQAESLVRWAHWTRLDARLAEIFVLFLAQKFRQIHPVSLWEENQKSPLPQALAVLVDFARAELKRGPSIQNSGAFQNWAKAVQWKLPKCAAQMFFLREGRPKPEQSGADIERSLRPYIKWGFFGAEGPVSGKKKGKAFTTLSSSARASILLELAKTRQPFTVKDYVHACGGQIHVRTAERDLRKKNELSLRGNTRARKYQAKRSRSRSRQRTHKSA
jgi:hypothetical protein